MMRIEMENQYNFSFFIINSIVIQPERRSWKN